MKSLDLVFLIKIPAENTLFYYFPYNFLNCSNLITSCIISNVCGNPSQQKSPIINHEITIWKT